MKKILSLILTACIILSLTAVGTTVAFAEGATAPVYKMLDISNGANSKLFVTEVGDTDFTPYVDYFIKHPGNANLYPAAPEDYTSSATGLQKGTSSSGSLGNLDTTSGIWTDNVTGITYKVNLNEKQIKLRKYDEAALTTEQKAAVAPTKSVVIDVENGVYSKLHFLTTEPGGRLKISVAYADGTTESLTHTAFTNPGWTAAAGSGNIAASWSIADGSDKGNANYFATVSVSTQINKVVDKVTLEISNAWGQILIPAISAQLATPDEIVATLPDASDISADNSEAVKKVIEQQLSAALTAYNMNEEDMSSYDKLTAIKDKLTELRLVVLETTSNVPLSIQDGAENKLFLERYGTDTDFVAFRDYVYLPPDNSGIKASAYKAGALYLPPIAGPVNDSFENVQYEMPENNKAVILKAYKTDLTAADTTAADKAAAKKVDTAQINLDNGAYTTLYFLAATTQDALEVETGKAIPKVEVYYTDGTTETKELPMKRVFATDEGRFVLSTTMYSLSEHKGTTWPVFSTYKIEVDAKRIVDKIALTGTGNYYASQIIIAMAATRSSVSSLIDGLSLENIETNYFSQGEVISEIIKRLDELELDETVLEEEDKTILNDVKNAVKDIVSQELSEGLAEFSPEVGTDDEETLTALEKLADICSKVGGDVSEIDSDGKLTSAREAFDAGKLEISSADTVTGVSEIVVNIPTTVQASIPDGALTVKLGENTLRPEDYTVDISPSAVTVTINNTWDYTQNYTVTLTDDVTNSDNSKFYLKGGFTHIFKAVEPVSSSPAAMKVNDAAIGSASEAAGQTVTFETTIKNNQAISQNYGVVFAVYSDTNEMLAVACEKGILSAGEDTDVSFTKEFPSGDEAMESFTVRCFVVDNFDNLKYIRKTDEMRVE